MRGEKGRKKNTEGEKSKKWKGKKKHGGRENRTTVPSIDLAKSPMPYPSPTVTLKLNREQFWADSDL